MKKNKEKNNSNYWSLTDGKIYFKRQVWDWYSSKEYDAIPRPKSKIWNIIYNFFYILWTIPTFLTMWIIVLWALIISSIYKKFFNWHPYILSTLIGILMLYLIYIFSI